MDGSCCTLVDTRFSRTRKTGSALRNSGGMAVLNASASGTRSTSYPGVEQYKRVVARKTFAVTSSRTITVAVAERKTLGALPVRASSRCAPRA